MPEELGNSFCLFLKSNKVKAFTFERLSHLLQTVTKISTLYNFHQCRVLADRLAAILSGETELQNGIHTHIIIWFRNMGNA